MIEKLYLRIELAFADVNPSNVGLGVKRSYLGVAADGALVSGMAHPGTPGEDQTTALDFRFSHVPM